MSLYLQALALTLLVEVPIVAACYPGRRRRMALTAAVATTVTHVFMHRALPGLVSGARVVPIGESLAIFVEAAAYARVARPHAPLRALLVSLSANAASLIAGWLFL